ncbi:putative membrane protein [Halanaeroarchaeum sp. HSR-CO]|uniref:hypothetical protein n=1 Tax=Halanaeroarchaeum sp. HSR-CO TaxID=2866382 RepID=UPI00217D6725|nr:hypothetical protein [Halanaeroarchaeum sp. HSR-CO]UWG47865.1 putative membrane protein [Halanaeroarchaeum sp. HSR-CO]
MTDHDQARIEYSESGIYTKTVAALAVAASRRDSRAVFLVSGSVYLVVYLVTVGDLSTLSGGWEPFTIRVAEDLSRVFARVGFFRFAAIAVVSIGPVVYLFSPGNALVAILLAGLVAGNVALTYLGFVQPRACGLESSTGVLGGIPALLSGAACCGPTILLVFGVQAGSTLITGFQLLVPVAVLLLLGSLLIVGQQVDPSLL